MKNKKGIDLRFRSFEASKILMVELKASGFQVEHWSSRIRNGE